jgi:hypothetical protein
VNRKKSNLKVKINARNIQKNILWKIYFLKTANSVSGCGHINKGRVVKISNFYLR